MKSVFLKHLKSANLISTVARDAENKMVKFNKRKSFQTLKLSTNIMFRTTLY